MSGFSLTLSQNAAAPRAWSAPPRSPQGPYLIVSDIDAARAELVARGAEASEVFHAGITRRRGFGIHLELERRSS